MHTIIDGKAIAKEIQQALAEAVLKIHGRKPTLAVILVGHHAPSQLYVMLKTKACESIGMHSQKLQLDASISEKALIQEIEKLNNDPHVDGILVQLPLPAHISATAITRCISPDKDIDGFHPINVGKLLIGESDGFLPCTPLGIKVLLERYKIETTGKHVVILGRSNIVGKPMAALLMQNTAAGNATVTVINRYSPNIPKICHMADILIVAIGKPHFVKAEMVKEGAVVIDVGINKVGHHIVGDVDFENVRQKCSFITPVPGGVGPMTIAMLLQNTLLSYQRRS